VRVEKFDEFGKIRYGKVSSELSHYRKPWEFKRRA